MTVKARGDVETDDHHTVEDLGIVLGQALRQAVGDAAGINRYGAATVPMDEALAMVALDLSGRPYLALEAAFPGRRIGKFETGLIEEFLRAFAVHGGITLHVRLLAGRNGHHMAEAIFKALGRALCQAVTVDPRRAGRAVDQGNAARDAAGAAGARRDRHHRLRHRQPAQRPAAAWSGRARRSSSPATP